MARVKPIDRWSGVVPAGESRWLPAFEFDNWSEVNFNCRSDQTIKVHVAFGRSGAGDEAAPLGGPASLPGASQQYPVTSNPGPEGGYNQRIKLVSAPDIGQFVLTNEGEDDANVDIDGGLE